jgi:hypothetical protein
MSEKIKKIFHIFCCIYLTNGSFYFFKNNKKNVNNQKLVFLETTIKSYKSSKPFKTVKMNQLSFLFSSKPNGSILPNQD